MIARLLARLAPLLLFAVPISPADAERRCHEGVAAAASIAEIVVNLDRWRGRCVAVTAASDGNMLFSGVEAYYGVGGPRPFEAAPDLRRDRRIGLDNLREMRRIPPGQITEVTAIGTVDDCQSLYDRAQIYAEGATISVQGYCRIERGPVIRLADLRIGRRLNLRRLVGEEARTPHGNLTRVPRTWPQRAESEQLAAAFLAALRARDRAALETLHLGSFGRDGGRDDAAFALSAASPFGEFARTTGPVQMELFVRFDLLGVLGPESLGTIICFCRGHDCSDRWPISDFDADNRPERPYVCTQLEPYTPRGRRELVFVTERTDRGLVEPRRTAFRRRPESSRR